MKVAVSGYFDPLHIGHIEYFQLAKNLAGEDGTLTVILNNDEQTLSKKGKVFMIQEERKKLIKSIRFVDEVYISIDTDGSVCKSLQAIMPNIFANGGDRYQGEVPETKTCEELGIKMVDGLGEKIQSSSDLIKSWEEKE